MKLLNKEIICYFDGYNIKDNYDTCVSSYQYDKTFSQNKFEILSEEDEEIDIDSIEELNLFDNGKGFDSKTDVRQFYDSNFEKISNGYKEMLRAIKQINKQMKEK